MIGNSCLKLFHAVVMRALVASTQTPDSPLRSPRSWKVGTASNVSSSTCTYVKFKLSVRALSPSQFLHLNMFSFFSVALTPEHLLWIQRLQVWQSIEFIPTPLECTPQGDLIFLLGFWASPGEPSILVLPTFILRPRVSRDVPQACNCILASWWQDHLHIGVPKGNQYDTHERELPSQWQKVMGLKQNLDVHQQLLQTSNRNSRLTLLLSLHHHT